LGNKIALQSREKGTRVNEQSICAEDIKGQSGGYDLKNVKSDEFYFQVRGFSD